MLCVILYYYALCYIIPLYTILYCLLYYILYIGMKLATDGMMYLGLCAAGFHDKTVITIDNNEFRHGTGTVAYDMYSIVYI